MGESEARGQAYRDRVRLHKALAHPIRLDLLGALGHRDLSPAQFARRRGEPVSNVTYHFRRLEELGCIELVRTRPVKGAIEHIYRRVDRVVLRHLAVQGQGWVEVTVVLEDGAMA